MAANVIAVKELDVLLCKTQTDNSTPATGLTGAEMIMVADGFTCEHDQAMTEVNYSTGTYGQEQSIKGLRSGNVAFEMFCRMTGSVTAPELVQMFEACGLVDTIVSKKHTLAPTSVESGWKWLTFWKYNGNRASAGDALLTKIEGVQLDATITWQIGDPIKVAFTGKGAAANLIAPSTFPSSGLYLPTTCGLPFVGGTITMLGQTNRLYSLTVTLGNVIELVKDPTAGCGVKYAAITRRATKFSAVVYQEDVSAGSPYSLLDAGTLSTVSVAVGGTDSVFQFLTTDKAQVVKTGDGDVGGLKTISVEGIVIDNDFSIVLNG